MEREYEVIRLIQQNASCHIITDCVLGTMLPEYLEEHEMIAKEQLFSYLCQMIKQLGYLQDVRDAKPYRYITPFCMIIKKKWGVDVVGSQCKRKSAYRESNGKRRNSGWIFKKREIPMRQCIQLEKRCSLFWQKQS
ncbi:MAG: hypothetical protein ACLTKE_00930 [Coprococcus sp.]